MLWCKKLPIKSVSKPIATKPGVAGLVFSEKMRGMKTSWI